MTDGEENRRKSAAAIWEEHTRDLLSRFATELRKKGVELELIKETLSEIWPLMEEHLHSIESEMPPPARPSHNSARSDMLGRLLVKRIEKYLPPPGDNELNKKVCEEYVEGVIPREAIPGLVAALKDMFGVDYIEEKEKACSEIAARYRSDNGDVDWEALGNDPDERKLVAEILSVAREKLKTSGVDIKTWLLKRISNADSFAVNMEREYGEKDLQLLIDALFSGMDEEDMKDRQPAATIP